MFESVCNGVRFIEGRPQNVTIIEPIRIEVGGILESAQLKNLDDVKRIMAERAISRGGNSIIDFRYGQRSVGFLRSLFQRDDVNWYGEGMIAVIS